MSSKESTHFSLNYMYEIAGSQCCGILGKKKKTTQNKNMASEQQAGWEDRNETYRVPVVLFFCRIYNPHSIPVQLIICAKFQRKLQIV